MRTPPFAALDEQTTSGPSYPFTYTYKLTGGIDTIGYPSGRSVMTTYDAGGRPAALGGSIGSSSTIYVAGATYAAHGALQQFSLGDGVLVEQSCYNARLQPVGIRLGSATSTNCANSGTDQLNLAYTYRVDNSTDCPSANTSNNGNVRKQAISRQGVGSWTQAYCYDSLNRLTKAAESGTGSWEQDYDYDRYGNWWLSAYTSLPMPTVETPIASTWYLTTNNRINGWTYATSGNLTSIAGMSKSFTYDPENRIATATINSQSTSYSYDGDGRRVKAVSPIIGTTTFVYDAFGQLATQYSTATQAATGALYLTSDHLGSTRLVTTVSGMTATTSKCYDYLPFGQELLNGQAGRTGCFGSMTYPSTTSDTVSKKFTGKERDNESGLDYFGARYMSFAQGRFTSPDAVTGTALHLINPQRWNMYTYGLNNPFFYTDPDGRDALAVNLTNQVRLFGHEGVISLHKDGTGTYARFGPEHEGRPDDVGEVKTLNLPRVDFDSQGVPTQASFDQLAKVIGAFENGQDPTTLKFAFYKTSETDTTLLDAFIGHFAGLNRFGRYHAAGNNCADFVACALTAGKAVRPGTYIAIPNLLQFELRSYADAIYQAPKKPVKEDIKKSHADCLIDRSTGQCAQ